MAKDAPHAAGVLTMKRLIEFIFNHRLRALIRKEFTQIRADRRLMGTLTIQPAVQLLLLGFALSATVSNLRLGVVDEAQTPESRALSAALTESKSFKLAGSYLSVNEMGAALSREELDAGVDIPRDYAREIERGNHVTVQFLINGVNANTAAIAQGYAETIFDSYNHELGSRAVRATFREVATSSMSHRGLASLLPAFLYNPGLDGSWFLVTGVFGLLLILNASLVSETTMIREREHGTIEQLLMSPASTTEIIIAKIFPLFVLLCFMILVAVVLMKFVFHVPFEGSVILVVAGAALCVLAGIGVGTVITSFSTSARQALLTGFFVNPLLFSLSGALNPVEGMPKWMQPLTVLNPIHHFANIARGALIKGSGFSDLWPNFLGLVVLTLVFVAISVWRFRKQLA
jgi:ABC-2 type transport system permease protein